MIKERSWDILIIGGSSGSGKSTIAYELGHFYELNVVKVDDIKQGIKALTTLETLPMLHHWSTGADWREIGVLGNVEWLIHVSEEISPALYAVIQYIHIDDAEPCILEGDFIHPAFGASFDNERVKSVFIQEPDVDQIEANIFKREGTHQAYRAEISCAHGNWLAKTCLTYGVPVVAPRLWDTLLKRVIDVLG